MLNLVMNNEDRFFRDEAYLVYFTSRYQVLAVATDAKNKEESQNIKSGKKVTVRTLKISLEFRNIQYF